MLKALYHRWIATYNVTGFYLYLDFKLILAFHPFDEKNGHPSNIGSTAPINGLFLTIK
jgi:hypothetical protein